LSHLDQDDEHPLAAELDITRSIKGTTIINGWLQNGAPTRQDFWDEVEEACRSVLAKRRKAQNERRLFGTRNTPLRFVMITDASEDSGAIKQQLLTDASGLTTSTTLSSANTLVLSSGSKFQDDLFKNKNWADDLDDDDQKDNVAVEPATEDDIVVEQDSTRTGAVFRKDEPVERCPLRKGNLLPKENLL
jgi:hypothetical protein